MESIAVVAVAYNRPTSLARLLHSLYRAEYLEETVDLIVSIDFSDNIEDVAKIAETFHWPFGKKIIRRFSDRQGLRRHILSCGDFAFEYSAIIMFEDDIVPSPAFYSFAKGALLFYGDESRVAGISLYAPMVNEMAERPFIPEPSVFDAYFLQSAQSWGQCWTRQMWQEFRSWYQANSGELVNEADMPQKIYSWPDTSWKKYFMKYIVKSNKYFVYPYFSLSTNASDVGFHNKTKSNKFQVPMLMHIKEYHFPDFGDSKIYDSFFEREDFYYKDCDGVNWLVCLDLYGTKQSSQGRRYVLSKKKLNYPIIKSLSASYRPHEVNFYADNNGEDIFLYDVGSQVPCPIRGKISLKSDAEYHIQEHWFLSLVYGFFGLIGWFKRKINNFRAKRS